MGLYRAMDRRALDAAYNNSAAVVESEDFLADWRERSNTLRARMPEYLDLAYADKEATRLDFFSCGRPAAPTLVFFHGGYWQRNSKEGFAFVAEGPLARGFQCRRGRLYFGALRPAGHDRRRGARALRWLSSEIAGPRRQPGAALRFRLVGGRPSRRGDDGEPAARGGIAISGLYDLEPIRLSYLNDKLRLDPDEARRNSPLLHLPAQAGKLIVAVGAEELPELRRQSADFAAAWRAHGLACELRELAACHHYAALEELANPEGELALALEKLAVANG